METWSSNTLFTSCFSLNEVEWKNSRGWSYRTIALIKWMTEEKKKHFRTFHKNSQWNLNLTSYLIPQLWANSFCIALVTQREPFSIFHLPIMLLKPLKIRLKIFDTFGLYSKIVTCTQSQLIPSVCCHKVTTFSKGQP